MTAKEQAQAMAKAVKECIERNLQPILEWQQREQEIILALEARVKALEEKSK